MQPINNGPEDASRRLACCIANAPVSPAALFRADRRFRTWPRHGRWPMTGRPFYEADTGDRIIAALKEADIAARRRLAPAAQLAGQQLELLQPAVLAHGHRER